MAHPNGHRLMTIVLALVTLPRTGHTLRHEPRPRPTTTHLATPRPEVGDRAPSFRLEAMNERIVTDKIFRNKTTLLVVGRTRKSAPLCRSWVLGLIKAIDPAIQVYQVAVTLKPWYAPKFMVRREIRKIMAERYSGYVLIDWRDHFAKAYGIPKTDLPEIVLVDRKARIAGRYRGRYTSKACKRVLSMLKRTDPALKTADMAARCFDPAPQTP